MLSSLTPPPTLSERLRGLFSHDRDSQTWFQIKLHFGSSEKQNPCPSEDEQGLPYYL